MSTAPFARQASSSARAARRDCQMTSSARRTKSMFASMALNAGIGTITPMRSSLTGRPRSGIAARREPGSISTTILTPTPPKMPREFGAGCSEHKAFVENERLAISRSARTSSSTLVRRRLGRFFADVTSAVAGVSVRRNSSSHAEHVFVASIFSPGITEDGRWRTTS